MKRNELPVALGMVLTWIAICVGSLAAQPPQPGSGIGGVAARDQAAQLVPAPGGGIGYGGTSVPLKPPTALDPLVRVITSSVEPDTWDQVGGAGTIESVDAWGTLVVSQTENIHEQIENLLRAVRAARQTHNAGASATATPTTAGPVSILSESPTESSQRQKIEEALSSAAKLDFNEAPLVEVAEYISGVYHIPAILDKKALDDVGIGSDTPVTIKVAGITLRSALRIMLKNLELTYVIRDEVLQITTPEEAEKMLVTRVYPVADLIVPPAK